MTREASGRILTVRPKTTRGIKSRVTIRVVRPACWRRTTSASESALVQRAFPARSLKSLHSASMPAPGTTRMLAASDTALTACCAKYLSTAAETGCLPPETRDLARAMFSPSLPRRLTCSAMASWSSVMVPVLSKTTSVVFRAPSVVSADLIMTSPLAAMPPATTEPWGLRGRAHRGMRRRAWL